MVEIMKKSHTNLNKSSLASGVAVAAFAATFAAVSMVAMGTSRRRSRKKESDFEEQVNPILVQPTQIYTPKELEVLRTCWDGSNPERGLLKERHGYTHFVLDGLENGPSKKGLIVVIHGVGESSKSPKEFADCLVHDGFSVLRYDSYGHGYSKFGGNDPWFKYTPDMLVDQLEDVLKYVLEETKERVVALVGHSTSGVVCIKANERWANNGAKRGVVSKLILLAPALYAQKVSKDNGVLTYYMVDALATFISFKTCLLAPDRSHCRLDASSIRCLCKECFNNLYFG
jgi:hypothetical protein